MKKMNERSKEQTGVKGIQTDHEAVYNKIFELEKERTNYIYKWGFYDSMIDDITIEINRLQSNLPPRF